VHSHFFLRVPPPTESQCDESIVGRPGRGFPPEPPASFLGPSFQRLSPPPSGIRAFRTWGRFSTFTFADFSPVFFPPPLPVAVGMGPLFFCHLRPGMALNPSYSFTITQNLPFFPVRSFETPVSLFGGFLGFSLFPYSFPAFFSSLRLLQGLIFFPEQKPHLNTSSQNLSLLFCLLFSIV